MSIPGWFSPRHCLLLIMLLALGVYAGHVNYNFIDSIGDNYTYELLAQTVFSKNPFMVNVKFDYLDEHPIYHHQRSFPPLYPIILASAHAVFGKSLYVGILLNCLIGVLCSLPLYHLGVRLGSEKSAFLAVLLTLFSPTLSRLSLAAMSEPLFTLASLSSLYYLVSYSETSAKKPLILAGIFASLAYLTRTNGAALILSALVYLSFRKPQSLDSGRWKQTCLHVLIFLSSAFLVSSPWFVRNYLIFKDPFYYVGRLFAGISPHVYYATVFQEPPTLSAFFHQASWQEIFNRYGKSALDHLSLIWRELTFLSLMAGGSFFLDRKKRGILVIVWLAILSNFLICLFHPYIYSRHLIIVFPLLILLACTWLIDFSPWLLNSLLNSPPPKRLLALAVLFVFLFSSGRTVYQGLSFNREIDFFSSIYPQIGQWFSENTSPDTVIMCDKTSPLAYYAERAVIMTPRGV